jgi:hypothetical protein
MKHDGAAFAVSSGARRRRLAGAEAGRLVSRKRRRIMRDMPGVSELSRLLPPDA